MENQKLSPSQTKDLNISFRRLNKDDKVALDNLIKEIESCLVCKEWWLPILKTSYDHFFDDDWTLFCGAFCNNQLVAASALFFNPFEYSQSLNQIHLSSQKVAEIGRCMVSPAYRGRHLMLEMNKFLLNTNPKNIDYFIATAHPENTPSINSLEALGLKKEGYYIKNGYQRNIYLLKKEK